MVIPRVICFANNSSSSDELENPMRSKRFHLHYGTKAPLFVGLSSHGGDDGIRTHDPLLAGQVLSQLSYTPVINRFCVIIRFCFFSITLQAFLVKFLWLPFFSKKVTSFQRK